MPYLLYICTCETCNHKHVQRRKQGSTYMTYTYMLHIVKTSTTVIFTEHYNKPTYKCMDAVWTVTTGY